MRRVAGQSSLRGTPDMTLTVLLKTLDDLPAVVARLTAIRAATRKLDEIDYAGADILTSEIDNALEALDGAPGALLHLAGLKHSGGDAARFERWDEGVAGRMRVGDLQ
jgi:hypothetical protein